MNWTPNKWLALGLSLFTAPLGLLYAGAPKVAGIFILSILVGAGCVFFHWPVAFPPAFVLLIQLLIILTGVCLSYRYAARAKARPFPRRPWYTRWYSLVGFASAMALVAFGVRAFFYEPFHIPSSSMAPTMEPGANVMVRKWGYGHYTAYGLRLASQPVTEPLRRGDIIVFDFPRDPAQQFVQRLVGLPGDTVVYRDGQLSVNGKAARQRQLEDYLDTGVLAAPIFSLRFVERLDGSEYDVIQDKQRRETSRPADAFPGQENCSIAPADFKCVVPAGQYFVLGDNRDNSFDSRYWGFVRANQVVGKVAGIFAR